MHFVQVAPPGITQDDQLTLSHPSPRHSEPEQVYPELVEGSKVKNLSRMRALLLHVILNLLCPSVA